MSDQADWVDQQLLQRLQARTKQPGIVRLAMGHDVVARMERMTKPPSLIEAVGQRWQSTLAAQAEQPPFVFAQPVQAEEEPVYPTRQTAVRSQPVTPTVVTARSMPITEQNGVNNIADPMPVAAEKQSSTPAAATPVQTKAAPKRNEVVSNGKKQETAVSPVAPSSKPAPVKQPLSLSPTPTPAAPKADAPKPIVARQQPSGHTHATVAQPMPMASAPQPVTTAKPNRIQTAAQPATSNKPNVENLSAPSSQPVSKPMATATAAPTTRNHVVVIATPAQAATTEAKMPVVSPNHRKATPSNRVVKPATHSAKNGTTPPPASPRPLVRPRATVSGTPPSFPTTMPPEPPTNGQSKPPFMADTPMPIARQPMASRQAASSSDLPLPKTAVATPAPAATPAMAGTGPVSGIIQRTTNDESSAAADSAATEESTQSGYDIAEIVAEVHRQFKRELAIEGERRGVSTWM